GRTALYIETDLSLPDASRKAVEKAVDEFGRIDILVNNAAYQKHLDSFEELDLEQFEYTFRVNIFGYFNMVKAALPHMKEGSCIINTSSILGTEGSGQLIDYAATKGAILAFTKSLAQSLMEKSIRVNAVAP